MITIYYNSKVKNIAGIETNISDVLTIKTCDELMHFVLNNDMPSEIICKTNEMYNKVLKVLTKFCKNLKINIPKIQLKS